MRPVPDWVKTAQDEIATYEPGRAVATAYFSAGSAIRLIALIQLAARHPGMDERERDFGMELVKMLAKGYKPEHKAIHKLIAEGWLGEHEQEVSA
jgi:hypothetical protein